MRGRYLLTWEPKPHPFFFWIGFWAYLPKVEAVES